MRYETPVYKNLQRNSLYATRGKMWPYLVWYWRIINRRPDRNTEQLVESRTYIDTAASWLNLANQQTANSCNKSNCRAQTSRKADQIWI